jgi:predicted nucleotidyltransferase
MTFDLKLYASQNGFLFSDRLLTTFIGGSELHGAKVVGTDDSDYYGIYCEPPWRILGVDRSEHFVFGSRPSGTGHNEAGDIDVCFYGLQKWAGLACKGNPSVLHFLFAPPLSRHFVWARLMQESNIFLARTHIWQFLGYAKGQRERMTGERGQKNCRRQDLVDKYGYDTKYAMHLIRLLGEGKELLEDGKITFPRPNKDLLIDIRNGKYTVEQIEGMAMELEFEAGAAAGKSPLPPGVDRMRVSHAISRAYREHWEWMESRKWPHEVLGNGEKIPPGSASPKPAEASSVRPVADTPEPHKT